GRRGRGWVRRGRRGRGRGGLWGSRRSTRSCSRPRAPTGRCSRCSGDDNGAADSSQREIDMTTVQTALGPIATSELGSTLMHEHVVTRSPGVQENWPHLWDRNGILDIAERKMAELYSRGIRSIVDLTTVDLGRDI